MNMENFKELTLKYENRKYFQRKDPVSFLWKYKDKRDIEVAAAICSTLAFGNRQQIYKACEKTLAIMGDSPFQYIMNGIWESGDNCWYRMLKWNDFYFICDRLLRIYLMNKDLEDVVSVNVELGDSQIESIIDVFGNLKGFPKDKKSCCKRVNLMLRWLVRQNSPIDVGIWKSLDPSKLLLPLDVHSLNTLRQIGAIKRKSNDMKTVVEATNWAKTICPDDPTRLDFFLFGQSYEQAHPQEFYKKKQLTSMDLLTSAIYTILYLNDNAVNLIKEIGYYLDDKDKESVKIYGALNRRINNYIKYINSIIVQQNMEFFAEFCTQMDEIYDPKIDDLKQAIYTVYNDVGYEDPQYLSLVEIARLMTEYVCKVNDKMTSHLIKISDKAKCLRGYKLEEIHDIMENFSTWTYRKCHDLDMNQFEDIVNKFHILDEAVSDMQNTLNCIEKANKYIGE